MKIGFLKIIAFFFVLCLSFFVLLPFPVKAANSLDVVINEIAWMGTEISYNDEWIELYNNTNSPIDLSGWRLVATDGTPAINLIGTIRANSFYLLERTDDTTVPGITANQIYTGALGNNGEKLELYDNLGNLIDSVDSSSGWFTGDNSTKQTMERTNSNLTGTVLANWQTSQNPGGTPKATNGTPPPEPVCQPTEEICDQIDNDCDGQVDEGEVCVAPEPTPEPEPQSEPTPATYPSGIFINEFLPSPKGPDSEGEWIEFYNNNAESINLSNWIIEDGKGVTKSYTFPGDTNIQSYGFLLLTRPTSKIILNNDGEGLLLKNPLGVVVDAVSYDGKAFQGQSFAKKNSGVWDWTLDLTPGEENSFAAPTEPEPELEPTPEFKIEPEPEDQEEPPEESYEVGPRKIVVYPSGVVINEILPSPTGSDAKEEWIEIFNSNNFEVNLFGWQVKDTTGRIKTYAFPKGTKISQKGYLVLSRPTTKITLNNDSDGVILFHPDRDTVDKVAYNKATTGFSYNRTGSGWAWSDILTPGSENVIPSQVPEEIEEEKVGSASEIQGKGVAAIGQLFPKSSRSLFTLLAAIVVAIFSGIIILILKRKVKIE